MPSLLHEGVLELVRKQPAFAADLLGQLLDIQLPRFTNASLADVTLNQIVPVEYRADAVVVFAEDASVFGAIIESQLQPDANKLFSWPLYAAGARARHRCPFVVIVVTPDAATATWAAQRIDLGGGNTYRPLVVGPEVIPRVTDRDRASSALNLAMLSVMAHGQGEVATAAAIGAAAAYAIQRLPEEQKELYSLLIEAALSEGARKVVMMQPGLENFFAEARGKARAEGRAEGKAEGRAEGKAEGRAEGKAEGELTATARAVLKILVQRGIATTEAQRQRILACGDLATLERYLDRAFTASSADDLFA